MNHFKFLSILFAVLNFSQTPLQAQENLPVEGAYPGRCAERYGRHFPGTDYTTFTCGDATDGYGFNNSGPNRIVPARATDLDLFPGRDFYFNFPGRHRQEMHLILADWPSEYGPDVRISKLYFFPRLIVPFVRSLESGQQEITLPNLDRVTFDAKTHEIKGGAFSELPMDLASYQQNRNLFAGITYRSELKGSTVLVRINRRGPASFHIGTAEITKQCGGQTCGECLVPTKDILMDASSEFRFADDASFSRYLMQKCGFGI